MRWEEPEAHRRERVSRKKIRGEREREREEAREKERESEERRCETLCFSNVLWLRRVAK